MTPLQVNEVLTYYSMLHRKPMGKYHVQICTNISCLLVGGEELWNRAMPEARASATSRSRPTGAISLEEVECIGACSWAPAVQVNYDFYHDVTMAQLEKLIDGLAAGKKPEEITEVQKVNPDV